MQVHRDCIFLLSTAQPVQEISYEKKIEYMTDHLYCTKLKTSNFSDM